jgi:hypothetical protein
MSCPVSSIFFIVESLVRATLHIGSRWLEDESVPLSFKSSLYSLFLDSLLISWVFLSLTHLISQVVQSPLLLEVCSPSFNRLFIIATLRMRWNCLINYSGTPLTLSSSSTNSRNNVFHTIKQRSKKYRKDWNLKERESGQSLLGVSVKRTSVALVVVWRLEEGNAHCLLARCCSLIPSHIDW